MGIEGRETLRYLAKEIDYRRIKIAKKTYCSIFTQP
jgi:hypothetical protein